MDVFKPSRNIEVLIAFYDRALRTKLQSLCIQSCTTFLDLVNAEILFMSALRFYLYE